MDLLLLGNTVYFTDLSYVLGMDYYACYFNSCDVLSVAVNYFIGLNLSGTQEFTAGILFKLLGKTWILMTTAST